MKINLRQLRKLLFEEVSSALLQLCSICRSEDSDSNCDADGCDVKICSDCEDDNQNVITLCHNCFKKSYCEDHKENNMSKCKRCKDEYCNGCIGHHKCNLEVSFGGSLFKKH